MALVWKKQTTDTLYEIRSAGKNLRLYTNGVFHTQCNPGNPLTGHIWDLLMLPVFFHSPDLIKRVLVLGVGGGAVIHLLKHFVTPQHIIGVELNPVHVQVARRFFGLNDQSVELVTADAVDFVKCYSGEKFDLIIDDLYMERDGEPVPVIAANASWFRQLTGLLSKQGMIVRNFIDREEVKRSAGLVDRRISKQFASVFQLTTQFNENFAIAYLRNPSSSEALRKRLVETPGLNPRLKTSRLRYRVRRLK